MKLNLKSGVAWFFSFVGVFAVLAAYVFWGTWSMDVAPVMPDDAITHLTSYSDILSRYWGNVISTGKVAPMDILWSGLLGSPYFCQELKYVIGDMLAALGLVYFLRGRGLSPLASYGAGLLLPFCGYWLTLFSAGHGGWFVWMSYGLFAFGLSDRAVRGDRLRHWLLLGLIVSWAGFQQQDLWLLFTLFTAFYFIWCCVRERKLPWKGALVSLVTFSLVGLPNFKDTFENTIKGRVEQISKGENITQKGETKVSESDKRWEFVTNWSMPTEDTLEFVKARAHGDTSCPFVLSINAGKGVRPYTGALGRPLQAKQGNYRQHSLYVGWVIILLALAGFASLWIGRKGEAAEMPSDGRKTRSDILFFAVSALVFYSFSLGRHFEPAYRIIFSLPAGDLIRCPVKWHHLTEFCLCVLAGYGIVGLERLGSSAGRWKTAVRICLGIVVVAGAANLACEAKRFCAPVNVGPARRTNSTMQLTVLPRQQFQDPQVAAMVRAGRIVSIANYLGNPDYFLVGVLEPCKPVKGKPNGTAIGLGLVSVLAALGAVFLSVNKRWSCKCLKGSWIPKD